MPASTGPQKKTIAMGSPLGPVLANIFMVKLEGSVISTFNKHVMTPWKRYVNNTISYEGRIY